MKCSARFPSSRLRGLGRHFPLLVLPVLLSGCNWGVLDPRGPIAAAEKTILLNSLAIMLAIVVPTIAATLGFAWWFRASNKRARYMPDFTYSGQVELVVWAIPAMVVLLLSGIAWVGSHDLEPSKPIPSALPALNVEVVALDWKWLFIYPDLGVASVNRLVIPANLPVSFRITSSGVMNSFFVPQLGSQIYAMAGMKTRLHLQADEPGIYPGISAHFSGDGFSDMKFNVEAMRQVDFQTWAASARESGDALDFAAYAELRKPSIAVQPFGYRAVTPGLFDAIVALGMYREGTPFDAKPNPSPAPDDSPSASVPLIGGPICSAS